MSTIIQNIALPDNSSDVNFWINYHKQLAKKYGKLNANSIFLLTWKKYGDNLKASSSSLFTEYFKSQGIEIETFLSPLTKIITNVSNIGADFVGVVGTFSKIIKYGVPLVILTGIGFTGFLIYKQIRK